MCFIGRNAIDGFFCGRIGISIINDSVGDELSNNFCGHLYKGKFINLLAYISALTPCIKRAKPIFLHSLQKRMRGFCQSQDVPRVIQQPICHRYSRGRKRQLVEVLQLFR